MGYVKWNDTDDTWNGIPLKWNDVLIAIEIENLVSTGLSYVQSIGKLEDKKQKRFVELTVLINNLDIYNGKKELKDITLTADNIKLTVDTILNKPRIDIDV
jgi:hypothetical protein